MTHYGQRPSAHGPPASL